MMRELTSSCFLQKFSTSVPSLHRFFLTVIFLGTLFTGVWCNDPTEPTVVLDPPRLAVEVNNSVEVRCNLTSLPGNFYVVSTTWYNEDEVDISSLNSSRLNVTTANDSTSDVILLIFDAEETDSGEYKCAVTIAEGSPLKKVQDVTPLTNDTVVQVEATPGTYNGTFTCVVYVMPTYLKEGMIILGINIFLAIIFLGCLARSILADKRRLAKYGRVASSG